MILSPEKWPLGVILPLIRRNNGDKELGYIIDDPINDELTIYVYLGCMYNEPTGVIPYTTVDKLLADGWVVD